MKRSEMLTVLHTKLVGTLAQGTARQILEIVEECGMAPPAQLILKESYDRSTGNYGYLVNEWEPEDEA